MATNAADPEILADFPGTPPTNFITARPSWMVLGTNDSVVVGIEYVAPRGAPDRRIAAISESGEISAVFPGESLTGLASWCVQPDGRLRIADHGLDIWRGVRVGRVIRLETDGTLDASFQVTLDPPEAWVSAMTLDDLFENPFTEQGFRPRVTAAAALPGGSSLMAVMDGRGGALIRRVLPDSDLKLAGPEWSGGELHAGLFTQPGRRYRVFTQDSLENPSTLAGEILVGDGYLSPVSAPTSGSQEYFHVTREPVGD